MSRLAEQDVRTAWQCASLLLDYPDPGLLESLPLLDRVVDGLPRAVAEPLRRTVTALSGLDLSELECAYVETFDSTRRTACS